MRFRSAMTATDSAGLRGDIGVRDSSAGDDHSFNLANPLMDGGRLQTDAATMLVEVELDYTIENDEEIWAAVDNPSTVRPTLKVLLGIGARIAGETGNDLLGADGTVPRNCRVQDLVGDAVHGLRLTRLDLLNLEGLQPQSILPEIVLDGVRHARFALCATFVGSFTITGSAAPGMIDRLTWAPVEGDPWRRFRLSVWPDADAQRRLGPLPEDDKTLPATLTLPGFTYGDPSGPTRYRVRLAHDAAMFGRRSGTSCGFRMVPSEPAPSVASARLGGIEFAVSAGLLTPDADARQTYSYWRFSPAAPISIRAAGGSASYAAADLDMCLRFDVERVTPIGGDVPRGNRQAAARPLLIPDGMPTGAGRFTLEATEIIRPDFDRQLTASIIDNSAEGAAAGSYVLLSERPFSIRRVRTRPLEDRGDQGNAVVASYDSDTRAWSVKLVTSTYHYVFPPQVAGESMDKPRRLELHDAQPNTILAPNGRPVPLPPYVPVTESPVPEDGALRRRAVEFRLTPPAELWIKPVDVERGYFLPEWATDRLFTENGPLGLGAALSAFRGEFLYGMAVGIDTAREAGPARSARVAEIGALLGRPPGPMPASRDDTRASDWDALSDTLARRPERLEMWMRDPATVSPFTPARFAAGVTFALRDTAVHAPPVMGQDLSSTSKAGPRIREHGLKGGAIWPLESANFCRQLLLRPESNGGTIERLALSPGGGDADQRAEFLNQQLAIIAEARNGFVQRHRVEIIGRIAVFWHRAKHVVVYERTVSPSEQFSPDHGIETRTRRPVLRKVSEYIELLQPLRSYPDFGTARSESTGFLRAARFNSKIINVDSAWSEDLGDFGWRIPLWDRHAATKRPHIYPRPDIAFINAAEGDGDAPTVAQECLDPDNLYFFADAAAGNADTDSWMSRAGIDYANLPPPRAAHQADHGVGLSAGGQASAPRVPRGHRRYTWRLAPAAHRTVLNAERGSAPLFAGLDTLTFMRSSATGVDEAQGHAQRLVDAMRPPEQPDVLGDIASKSDQFRQTVHGGDIAAITASGRALVDAFNTGQQQLKRYVLGYIDPVSGIQPGVLQKLDDVTKGAPARCDKMVGDFVGTLQRKKLLILDRLRSWEAMPVKVGLTDVLGQPLPTPAQLADRVAQEVEKVIAPVTNGVSGDVARLGAAVEQGRTIVRDLETDVKTILEGADGKLDALRASYDMTKPWSPNRLAEFQVRVATIRKGVEGDVAAAIGELQSRLATELDAAAQQITREVSSTLGQIAAGGTSITQQLGRAENAAAAFLRTVDTSLEQSAAAASTLEKDIDDRVNAMAPGDQNRTALGSVKQRVVTIAGAVAGARAKLIATAEAMDMGAGDLAAAMANTAALLASLATATGDFLHDAAADLATLTGADAVALKKELGADLDRVSAAADDAVAQTAKLGERPDWLIGRLRDRLAAAFAAVDGVTTGCFSALNKGADAAQALLVDVTALTTPALTTKLLHDAVIEPAMIEALSGLGLTGDLWRQELIDALSDRLADVSTTVERYLDKLDITAEGALKDLSDKASIACGKLGSTLDAARDAAEKQLVEALGPLQAPVQKILDAVNQAEQQLEAWRALATGAADAVDTATHCLSAAAGAASAYADRVFEAAGNVVSGGIAAAPSNILRLYAAAASKLAIEPSFDTAKARLGYYYKELNKVIDTTPAEAWFGHLGDELKALGLNLPFSQIGDGLIPDKLGAMDIGKVFRNFGGIDLSKLFEGYKLPAGAGDAIRVSHAFDKEHFRAWVQIDIDLPLPGRKSLFTAGPFSLDMVDSQMTAVVRLEASKDDDRVEQTGRASLTTNVDAVVSGQSMVTLEKIVITYERSTGLKVDFDPKNIRLNPAFRFIQDTLGTLIPDALGGLRIVKLNGIPVGVEHEFAMPPVSLMYGTSGVSNIQINNHFSLIAYPDFVIANRFALSRPELPFLFSIFVIGGTGYISIDCEYRPFENRLMVVVEAAAGGSAALGFAVGPISGSVFVSLSIALSYRKLIGTGGGGGLTASLVLVIAGNVDVAGLATVYIGVTLRMSYRDNGQIDGLGSVSVEIKISRFYTFHVRRDVHRQLRGGSGGGQGAAMRPAALMGGAPPLTRGQQILNARG